MCYILPSKNTFKNLHNKKFNYRFRKGYDLNSIETKLIILRGYYNVYKSHNIYKDDGDGIGVVQYFDIDKLLNAKKELEFILKTLDDYDNNSFGGTRKQKNKFKKVVNNLCATP